MNAYNSITPETIQKDMRYLQLLSHSFPIADASTEIINLEAILNLPKGTEHFLADLHGEYEAFQHVLRNASGAIKRKVNEIFGNTLRENEKKELCTLIYYPEQKLDLVKAVETDLDDWYVITLNQLVRVCQNVSKYTRSQSATSQRILVYHSGIVARTQWFPTSRRILTSSSAPSFLPAAPMTYHCFMQPHPTAHHRHSSHVLG